MKDALEDVVALELDSVGYDLVELRRGGTLTSQRGKLAIVQSLKLSRPRLAVGDGATDVSMRDGVDAFAAYTGFIRRESVVADADFSVSSYDELARRILPE